MKPPLSGRYKNPFLLSYLPAFLRGSGAIVVEAILFGCGYAALGFAQIGEVGILRLTHVGQ